jgi:hypothetical protein
MEGEQSRLETGVTCPGSCTQRPALTPTVGRGQQDPSQIPKAIKVYAAINMFADMHSLI